MYGGEGGILATPFPLCACNTYTYVIIRVFFRDLQASPILGYSFYSFSYSLQFR